MSSGQAACSIMQGCWKGLRLVKEECWAEYSFMLQALEGLNRLTKGLTLQLCTVKRPAVGEQLAVPLQAALSISQVCLDLAHSFFIVHCKWHHGMRSWNESSST